MPSNHTLTISELFNFTCFNGYKVLAGKKGINRRVKWAHILEVTEVGTLINGGELILTTGIGWSQNPDTGVKFVKELILRGAAGICIELHTYIDNLPEAIIHLAEDADFPIIVFERQVRFIDITRKVYDLLHFPTPEKQFLFCLQSLWNGSDFEQLEETKKELFKHHADLPVYSALILGNFKMDIACLYSKAKKNQLSFIHSYLSDIPGHLILWFDESPNTLTFKNRIFSTIQTPSNNYKFILGAQVRSIELIQSSITTLKKALDYTRNFKSSDIVIYEEFHTEKLLTSIGENDLQNLIYEYLMPLIEYDRKNDRNLLFTLYIYLQCLGNKKEAASRLFIVRQTLYHRLEKLEEILGRDFIKDNSKRLMLEVALAGYFTKSSKSERDTTDILHIF
ncbi:PucR family transcriptional regulator [Bacillus sp. ISL-47]|uniref:PucR family transcriptional regulator n=1 Tax=Bacillus sp. ISL-47 TaxID=2819130 RepID=UPI001BEADADB|nr:PucR family transcriptional regulator [Bacillus sp. ISL-47]MBT2688225.1 PucR family transcriptional regulator [Bacillus sp. ISL-47]MBT2710018.1 PucR family transcriptional regulator [Pseudomonas sp. ISL-84]